MSEFFTQRRKGAKKENELQDLSALASLREISGAKYVSKLSDEALSSISHIRRKIV
jgi:hypothetical protein